MIRRATSHDIPRLTEIARQAATSALWSPDKYEERIAENSGIVLVAEQQRGIVGFIVAHVIAGECEIENVAVARNHWRKGHGRALVEAVISAARERGCDSIWLEVRESNLAARALYNSFGFAEDARRRRYYRDPEEDALILKLTPVNAPT